MRVAHWIYLLLFALSHSVDWGSEFMKYFGEWEKQQNWFETGNWFCEFPFRFSSTSKDDDCIWMTGNLTGFHSQWQIFHSSVKWKHIKIARFIFFFFFGKIENYITILRIDSIFRPLKFFKEIFTSILLIFIIFPLGFWNLLVWGKWLTHYFVP